LSEMVSITVVPATTKESGLFVRIWYATEY